MDQPIVIAHRGASAYVPEHTLMAKAMAHAYGADYLEQDVVSSKEGVPLVLHDEQIDTVTDVAKQFPDRHRHDGRFYAIDFTVNELKQLNVSERFHHRTGRAKYSKRYPVHEGEFRIATLDEEITFIKNINHTTGRAAGIYPEIKHPAWHRKEGADLAKSVIDVLNKHGYTSKEHLCYLQCFDHEEVIRIRDRLGYQGLLIQLIDHQHGKQTETDYMHLKTKEGLKEISRVADGIGPSLRDVVSWSPEGTLAVSDLVDWAHDVGLDVHPWTFRADDLPKNCPSSDELLDACYGQAKIDGMFADHPDLAVEFLRSQPTE